MRPEKGDYGYISSQKKIRLRRTIIYFIPSIVLFIVGLVLNDGERNNIYTVIAAVGCIPGCIQIVLTIMMFLRKPMSEELHNEIALISGKQTMAYELYVTTENFSLFLDAVLFSGEVVTAYCDREAKKDSINVLQDHIRKSLANEKYESVVKIFDISNKKQFMERVSAGNDAYDKRNHSVENGMKNVLLTLAL